MKKITCFMAAVLVTLFAAGSMALITEKMVDNFERNKDLKSPEWWKYDNVTVSVVNNPPYRPGDSIAKACGNFSLSIKGSASNWYCGGVGTYLGVDATGFTGVEMSIFGYGEGSGKVKIELYDDDKGSWETLYDKNWVPIKDDIWYYEQAVDWRGWKKVYLPFSTFRLSNPGKGDNKLTLDQNRGSGGLLQMQLVFLAPAKDGEVNMNIDNIKLVTREDSEE